MQDKCRQLRGQPNFNFLVTDRYVGLLFDRYQRFSFWITKCELSFGWASSGGAVAPTFRSLAGADLPNPSATTLGGVQSAAAVSHQWINSISTSGVPALSQPAFSDISGSLDAATQLTGIAPIANGGTGTSNGSITGTGALTFAAGGTNQNVVLTPSGTALRF
jgi:hypothetical protein